MDVLTKTFNYILDYLGSIPAASWYVLGSLLASSGVVIGIVAWINRHHLKEHSERLKTQFIALNVVFWSTVTTVLSFVLTNGGDFAPFLPYLGTHLAQVMALATTLYQVSKPMKQWWIDRKDKKKFVLPELPVPDDLDPAIRAVTSPVPPEAPSQKFLQL